MVRKSGFYWVNHQHQGRRIALWYDDYKFWQHPDLCSDSRDSDFIEIDEKQIVR